MALIYSVITDYYIIKIYATLLASKMLLFSHHDTRTQRKGINSIFTLSKLKNM